MNPLSVALQTLAVAAAAFAAMWVLTAHLRYRKALLVAEAETVLSAPSAALLLLDRLRREPVCLLDIRPVDGGGAVTVADLLRERVRKEDRVWRLEGGSTLVVLRTDPAHLPRVAERLGDALVSKGFGGGVLRLTVPEADPEGLLNWLGVAPEVGAETEWRREPAEWPQVGAEPVVSPMVDPLTGVLRPERVPQALRRLMASTRRRNRPLTLMRVDVDQLEDINREHGREAGDAVLRGVAQVLMAACRETDLIGRVEEDEFLICLPGPADVMSEVAVRLSSAVRDAAVPVDGKTLRCTVCCGLASAPVDGQNPTTLFARAGLALASAKKRGRGSCRAYDPELRTARPERPRSEAPADHF